MEEKIEGLHVYRMMRRNHRICHYNGVRTVLLRRECKRFRKKRLLPGNGQISCKMPARRKAAHGELIGADVPHLGVSADQRRSSGNLQKLLRVRNRRQTVFQNKGVKARGEKAQCNRFSLSGYAPAVSAARTD